MTKTTLNKLKSKLQNCQNIRKINKFYKLNLTILETETKKKLGVETCCLYLKEALLILISEKSCIYKRTELMEIKYN